MDIKEVEEIMKNYHEQESNFLKTGENTALIEKEKEIKDKKKELKKDSPDVNSVKEEIERETLGLKRNDLHTQRLEDEMKEVLASTDMDSALKSKLEKEYQEKINKNQEEKQEINQKISELQKNRKTAKTAQNEKVNEELEKLEDEKQEMITEKKQNERELREKIYRKVNDLQDETRKQLMQYKKQAEDRANEIEALFQEKMLESNNFSYTYDENGHPTNGEEYSKIQEDINNLIQEKYKCLEAANKCEEYRNTLITPFKMPPELPDDKIYTGEFVIEQEKEPKIENVVENEIEDEIKQEDSPKMESEPLSEDIVKKLEDEIKQEDSPKVKSESLSEDVFKELEDDENYVGPHVERKSGNNTNDYTRKFEGGQQLNTEELMNELNEEGKDISNKEKSNKKEKNVKIEIGRKGKISINDREFVVSNKIIKQGVNLTEGEKHKIILSNPLCNRFFENKTIDEIKDYIKNVDGAVLITIKEISKRISQSEYRDDLAMENLMVNYLKSIDIAKNGEENDFELVYDIDDLSKSNILKRMFRREVNEQDKFSIRKYAKKYERYEIAEQKGKYKGPDFVTRLVSKVTRRKPNEYLLPTREDEEMAAWMYNKVRTEKIEDILENATPNARKKFVKNLEVKVEAPLKNGNILIEGPGGKLENDVQYNEFEELRESQKKQDDEYYLDDNDKDDDKSR